MKTTAVSTAVSSPKARSTGTSVATRASSAMRYSGLWRSPPAKAGAR